MARNDFWKTLSDIDKAAASLLLTGPTLAAQKIVEDLQERGPAWTGSFSNSWQIEGPQGQLAKGDGQPGQPRPIKLPALTFTGAQAARVLLRTFATKNKVVYEIRNFSPYADEARDLVPFTPPKDKIVKGPISPIEDRGYRPDGGRRGEVSGTGNNRTTAPLDWYSTYVGGGFVDKVIQVTMDGVLRKLK